MFKLAKKTEGIKWPVHINEPRSGGVIKEHVIHVHFILKDQDAIDELVELGNYEFMKAVIDPDKGWDGVTQEGPEGDVELPYSHETLDQLMQVPYVMAGFVQGYFSFVSGVRQKNSGKRRSGG